MEQNKPIDSCAGDLRLCHDSVKGPKGMLEIISGTTEKSREDLPVLFFVPGWWGSASDYRSVFDFFCPLGFTCRALSFRGTGVSEGSSFWGQGFEHDLIPVLKHIDDPRTVLVAHSGAIDPVRNALPILHRSGFTSQIEAIILISPLARSGAFPALLRFLKPDSSGTTIRRWTRFLGSNALGLTWFMRNSLAIRRVLLSDYCSEECVSRVLSQVDNCPFGRYVLGLARTFWPYPDQPFSNFGVRHSLLIHTDLDRNFSRAQQKDTAKAVGAEFVCLEKTCHQWFAEPYTFKLSREQILSWLTEKGLFQPRPALEEAF